jgi:hypothetical protein
MAIASFEPLLIPHYTGCEYKQLERTLVTYDPTIFDVGSMEQAQWVALRPDGVRPPEEFWGLETDYLMEIVDAYLPPRDATALDFGCGPGRLAKPLIERKNLVGAGSRHQPDNCGVRDRVRQI